MAHAQTSRSPLTQGRTLFWQITQFILIVEPRGLHSERQIWVRDFKYLGKICSLRTGHVIRRMRSGSKRIVNGRLWWTAVAEAADIITHKSRTDMRRIFKLGGGVARMTCHV